jgi:DNA repair exonuclease SbcCD ATPase subunit
MPKLRALPWLLALALMALLLAVSALTIRRFARNRAAQTARIAQLEAENRDLRARSQQLTHERQEPAPPVPAPAPGAPRARYKPEPAGAEQESKLLSQLRENLATANASLAELQAHAQELQASLDRTAEENKRLADSEADLKEKLAADRRVLEAVQAELKGKSDRLVQLETTSNLLHQENRALSEKSSLAARMLRELEEINRRRETYLTSILRRYKDVTEQYRALATRLESPRDNVAPPAPELSRIQATVASAEEDLRQLATLNAQAARIQQKLAGK